jgi:hypothetical protein
MIQHQEKVNIPSYLLKYTKENSNYYYAIMEHKDRKKIFKFDNTYTLEQNIEENINEKNNNEQLPDYLKSLKIKQGNRYLNSRDIQKLLEDNEIKLIDYLDDEKNGFKYTPQTIFEEDTEKFEENYLKTLLNQIQIYGGSSDKWRLKVIEQENKQKKYFLTNKKMKEGYALTKDGITTIEKITNNKEEFNIEYIEDFEDGKEDLEKYKYTLENLEITHTYKLNDYKNIYKIRNESVQKAETEELVEKNEFNKLQFWEQKQKLENYFIQNKDMFYIINNEKEKYIDSFENFYTILKKEAVFYKKENKCKMVLLLSFSKNEDLYSLIKEIITEKRKKIQEENILDNNNIKQENKNIKKPLKLIK